MIESVRVSFLLDFHPCAVLGPRCGLEDPKIRAPGDASKKAFYGFVLHPLSSPRVGRANSPLSKSVWMSSLFIPGRSALTIRFSVLRKNDTHTYIHSASQKEQEKSQKSKAVSGCPADNRKNPAGANLNSRTSQSRADRTGSLISYPFESKSRAIYILRIWILLTGVIPPRECSVKPKTFRSGDSSSRPSCAIQPSCWGGTRNFNTLIEACKQENLTEAGACRNRTNTRYSWHGDSCIDHRRNF